MLIQHEETDGKGSFYVETDNERVAELTYTKPAADKMIIDHTGVDEKLKGQNVGGSLVHAAVEFARTNSLKIIPLCPFARAVFNKKAEYADVLA